MKYKAGDKCYMIEYNIASPDSQILEQLHENVCIDLILEILHKTSTCFVIILNLNCCNPKQVGSP